ncbi:MAG: glutamine synthetase [Haliscomenobacter sp.]|uniref:glutamine synthetase family protein n=1 Tax=Haliscomenobacter sp. TaxID=2717303 RepID=UPI0029B135DF|nr:glutamine synthetase [Haliscomenobacter sp.]MDX2069707.1 glutamine synthetase [Haliscomenobacter sp.]
MTSKDIASTLNALPTDKVKYAIVDIDGILRGKILHRSKFLKGLDEGMGFCNVVFGWDSNDVCYDNTRASGWHTGYPDAICNVDLNTLRYVPWEDNIPFFLGDFSQAEPGVRAACPRSLLRRIRQECLDLGYTPMFAQEFEWFNFKETPQSWHDKDYHSPTPLTPGMFGYSILRPSVNPQFYHQLFDDLQAFGIPLEGLHTETGPGVYEAAIIFDDILESADRATLFKTGVKEIAYRHGIMASFMAKWSEELPGCGGHIHQSLWDPEQKQNLFYQTDAPEKMSELMQHYVAGQLHCLPYILPMFVPNVNSYKRLVKGSWASVSASWGIENRTTALRVINHGPKSMRLETRVPGADSNPYLAMSACLAAGLYGIKNRLTLPDPVRGSAYDNTSNPPLPTSLYEAVDLMKSSTLAAELFGAEFCDHFIRTREWEWRQFSQAVTQWELKRYFEII